MALADLEQLTRDVVDAFTKSGLACAVGGSLALNVWALPRMTLDLDVNVFVEPASTPIVLDALRTVDPKLTGWEEAEITGATDGQFRVYVRDIRVCVFLAPLVVITPGGEDLFSQIRARVKSVGGLPYLDATATAFFKLLFHRTKDIADLEVLFQVAGAEIDPVLIERWMEAAFERPNPRFDLLRRLSGA